MYLFDHELILCFNQPGDEFPSEHDEADDDDDDEDDEVGTT